jgi:DNA-binding response OmpR family regulator
MPPAPATPEVSRPRAALPAVLVVSPRELLLGAMDDSAGEGLRIVRTTTGRDALAQLAEDRFDLILLDIILADGDGRSFLRRIRDDPVHAEVPVVVADPVGSREMVEECRALGVDSVLPPGTSRNEIRQAVLHRIRPGEDAPTDLWSAELAPGLLNRAGFRERFEDRVAALPSASSRPLLVRIAPDDLAALSRDVPEAALASWVEEVARVAAAAIPAGEGLARWERADFVSLWVGTPIQEAIAPLEAARRALSDVTVPGISGPIRPRFSCAVAPVPPGAGLDTAMDVVRTLLLEARGRGGDRLLHPGASAPRTSVRILLADDDPLTAAIVVHRLRREGMEITHVADGLTALDEALAGGFSLLILDVKMPGIDGFDLLARIREAPDLERTPVLMLTGLGRETDIVRGFALGADDYMVKPFSPAELMARVGRLLASRASPRLRP